MKKFWFFLIIIFCTTIFSQETKNRIPLFFNYISIPAVNDSEFIIVYKIPYNKLVFVKNKNQFKAGVSVSFDIKKDSVIERVFDERSVSTKSYNNTLSSKLFLEGIVKTRIKPGKYKIIPSIEVHNTNISVPFPEFEIQIKKENNLFLKPLVIKEEKYYCDNNEVFIMENIRGNILFSSNSSKLLIPVQKYSPDSLKIRVKQNNKELFFSHIGKTYKGKIKFSICDNKITISKDTLGETSFYELTNFGKNISEGKFEIKIESGDKSKTYMMESEWIDKPKSLYNITLAVKVLKIIEEEDNFDKNFDSEYKDLVKFWKRYDPTPDTEFNELMNEFYSRVDYSIKKFSTLKSFDGAFTDRGKTFIKYGEPDIIDRNYNKRNEVIETWTYKKQNILFTFKDISGSGNFEIVK